MACFNYKCPNCSKETRRIVPKPTVTFCDECNVEMVRAPKPPTTQVKEVLDNGLMPRKVERLRDAEDLNRNRTKKT